MRARFRHRRYRTPVWSLSLLAALCWAPPAAAQYGIDAWTTDQGLPQNIVYAVHHARDGYLWIATHDGLARFDGVRFTVFERGNVPGIGSNRFTCIYESVTGELWFGTTAGVTRLRDGAFTTYTTDHGLPDPLVTGITGDQAGRIWAVADGSVVGWVDGRFRPIDEAAGVRFDASRWTPGVFLGFDGRTLYQFSAGALTSWPAPEVVRTMGDVELELDESGLIWVRGSDQRYAVVDDGRLVRVYTAAELERALARDVSERGDPIARHTDGRGRVWPLQVDPELGRRMTFESAGERHRIRFDALHEDREGNIWLAVRPQGLYRVREQQVRVLSRQHGLPTSNIYPLLQDRAGAIWIGTWDSGLSRYHDGQFTNYAHPEGLGTRWITAIAEDAAGRIWVAGYHEINGGIRVFDGTRFNPLPDRILPDRTVVPAIHHEPDGTAWFGTGRGLMRYREGAITWYRSEDGLASDDVKVVISDRAGGLWIGGHGGVSHLSGGRVRSWTERDGVPGGVRALYLDDRGVLWIGSYDSGLGRLADGRAARITTREGLFNNGAFQILEDGEGYLWMGCNRGIYRVRRADLDAWAAGRLTRVASLAVSRGDGLLSAEANGGTWPAGLKAADGTLWFPTQDGVAIIDPASWQARAGEVPVLIEAALIDREPVPLDRRITLRPAHRHLEIEYTGLSFVGSEHITFRHRLSGLDDEWVDAGTRRTAHYSYVPPGEYIFSVIAAGADGVWSSTPATIAVRVVPPFWRTWWFGVLALWATGGLAVFGYRRRVTALERARKAQEAFSRELIASQERERNRIAGELHDGLGQSLIVLRNWAALGVGSLGPSAPGREELDEISRAAGRAIEEMRAIVRNLGPCDFDRMDLAGTLTDMIERLQAASSVRFRIEVDELDGCLSRERATALYRVAQEALTNVVKHSGAAEATVVVTRAGPHVALTIADDGHGFDAAAPAGGFGLRGMAERMRLAGGELTLQSAPGQGTVVRAVFEGEDSRAT